MENDLLIKAPIDEVVMHYAANAKAAGLATLYMHTNLTPPEQAEADPALLPGIAPADCRHWEYEGSDWQHLEKLLECL